MVCESKVVSVCAGMPGGVVGHSRALWVVSQQTFLPPLTHLGLGGVVHAGSTQGRCGVLPSGKEHCFTLPLQVHGMCGAGVYSVHSVELSPLSAQ